MNQDRTCPECGKLLSPSAPGGLCPGCLLKRAGESNTVGFTAEDGPTARWMPPEVGELSEAFPDLEILRLIGRGGMGAVYQARQKGLDRIVALKILPPEMAGDPAFAERFAREAQAMARLNHPHIVDIYDFGQRSSFYFFVMEYVDGVSLRSVLDGGRIAPKEALAIVPQICEALQYAHDQGIVHRDIKPENILLNKQGQVKIADFGLAKLMGRDAVVGEKVMGTPQYMAPEQTERPAEVDHRADIFSLGVVLYQMLTGELPVGRFALPSKKVQVDVRLDEVVLKALEREPEKRYQQASEVKTQIDTIAAMPGRSGVEALPVANRANGTAATPSRPTLDRRLVMALILVPVGMLLAVGLVAVLVFLIFWSTAPQRVTVVPTMVPAVPTMPSIPSFSDDVVTSGISVEVSSKGEMTVEAKNAGFGYVVMNAFNHLPEIDPTASRAVDVNGNAAVGTVTCRFTIHNRDELVEQLQMAGSCPLQVKDDGKRMVVTMMGANKLFEERKRQAQLEETRTREQLEAIRGAGQPPSSRAGEP